MLLGRPCNDPADLAPSDISAAANRVRKGFAFIGIVEEWDLSVCLFHRLLGKMPLSVENTAVRVQTRAHSRGTDAVSGRDVADETIYHVGRAWFWVAARSVLDAMRRGESTLNLTVVRRQPLRRPENP